MSLHLLVAKKHFPIVNLHKLICRSIDSDGLVCRRLLRLRSCGSSDRTWIREYRAAVSLFARSSLPASRSQQSFFNQTIRLLSSSTEPPKNEKDGQQSGSDDPDNKKKDDEDPGSAFNKAMRYMIMSYVAISILSLFRPADSKQEFFRSTSWNEFLNLMLAKGEVQQIVVHPDIDRVVVTLHEGAMLRGRPAPGLVYHMTIPNVQNFETKLRAAEKSLGIRPDGGVPVIYERKDDLTWIILLSLIAVSIITAIMSKSGTFKMSKTMDLFSGMTKAKFTVVDPSIGQGKGVKFADVAGLKEAKVEISEFVDYLKSPQRYRELGAKVPRGVLLLGPPGCGKTMLAKAVATESSVPFLAMNGSEFVEMIGGLGAARVRDLFKEARKRSPCIIYIDEIDAIGRRRSDGVGGGNAEEEQTLNQLLVEMDGMAGREGVILLASTNRAEVLDKALLRPGRFDRHILIDYPTLAERIEIFNHHLKVIKLEHPPTHYSTRMAQLTPGFTGADIANVCNESALNAARTKNSVVRGNDLEYAIERVVGGTEKRTSVMSPTERRVVAYHESGHALVGWLLKYTDALLKVSIVPRTSAVLGFAMNLPSDQKLYSTEELFEKMCMALGGRVAESLTFNRISTGAENDLKKVTEMAYAQIRQFGMDPVVGPLSFPSDQEVRSGGGRKPFSKKLGNTMDMQARLLVASVYRRTEELLNQNRDKLKILAESLLQKETLNYSDIVQLIGPPPYGEKKKVDLLDFGPTQAAETPTQPPKDPPPPPPVSPNGSEESLGDDTSQKSHPHSPL